MVIADAKLHRGTISPLRVLHHTIRAMACISQLSRASRINMEYDVDETTFTRSDGIPNEV